MSAIKPKFGRFNRNEVATEWGWFWERKSLCVMFNEYSTKPLCLINGQYQDIITATVGATGGTSNPKLDSGPTGVRADFSGADGSGGGEWAYHIADSALPDWFPGKDGGAPSDEFTCLLLIEPEAIQATPSQVVLQKDATTGVPFFCFIRADIRCNLGAGTSISATTLSAGREEMVGCVHDGTNQNVISQARWQSPLATAITTNTGPLNIGTRSATIDTFVNRFDGGISGIIFIDTAIDGKFLQQLEANFFGPFTSVPVDSLFDQQPILSRVAQSVKVGQNTLQTAGKAR